jgi:hypothetical protein
MLVLASLQASTDKLFMTLVPQSDAQSPQFYHYCGSKSSKHLVKCQAELLLRYDPDMTFNFEAIEASHWSL